MRLRTKLLLAYLGLSIILFTCGGGGIALQLVKRAVKSNIESNLSKSSHRNGASRPWRGRQKLVTVSIHTPTN